MLQEVKEVKKFLGAKFGYGEFIPDGVYAIPTNTRKGKAFMKYESKNGSQSGEDNFHLYWDEKLTMSWFDCKKPLFLKESKFSKAFRKLQRVV